MSLLPSDHAQRDTARASRGQNLVLEAGAGTGKTTLLIDRILSLLLAGDATLLEIAAVTFTENAAATMKLRLREQLERARSDPSRGKAERQRATAALDVLERSQISTIHALAASILQEWPLECGVTPGFRVADESQAEALFAEAWEGWLAERLDAADPVLAEALRREIPLVGAFEDSERYSLRGLARSLLWQRDLEPLIEAKPADPARWREELLEAAGRAQELCAASIAGDSLAEALKSLVAFAQSCQAIEGEALRERLLALPKVRDNLGRRGNWRSAEALAGARELARFAREASERWRQALGSALHAALVAGLEGVLTRYHALKQREGVLDFVDLLVRARDALRDRPSVRRKAQARFRHLMIDEFQDTDPLQVEIATSIAGSEPGGLVVVGDAKQSIYRFRRADVALFRRLAEAARQDPSQAVLRLRQNFRSRPAILRFVNRAFSALITASIEADQASYEPIDAPPNLAEGPAVLSLQFAAPELADRAELLAAESAAAAALIAYAAAGGYEVRDVGRGASRPSRAGDVMVLAPRLTQLRTLEEALDRRGIAFAVDGGKSFFDRQEVHETLATLRAIEDPSDRMALVAALRSSFFGVSDRELVHYALRFGLPWVGLPREPADAAQETIDQAVELLSRLNRARQRVSVAALLEQLYEATRVLASMTGTWRGPARAANLEKVVALARQADALGALTLRGFIRVLTARIEAGSEEPDLPLTRPGDPDTVRILSIHKAKGLEAPIVLLHDMAANLQVKNDVISLWQRGQVAIGFREGCRPPGWNSIAEADARKARAEGRRLLYVAATRARDWLVVPQPPADAQTGDFWRDLLPYLANAPADEVQRVDVETLPVPSRDLERIDGAALDEADGRDAVAERWEQERQALLTAAARRPLAPIAATRAAARLAPPPVVAQTGAEAPGGRDFGSLVHRLLEWVPLAGAPAGRLAAMATALAPTFGLDAAAAARAAAAVERTLQDPVFERARRSPRLFRELPLWFPENEELIEGVIDLVFEEAGGWVIVDYKSDAIADDQALAQAAHHAPQLQLYGRGLAQATGISVRERLVLFTTLARTIAV